VEKKAGKLMKKVVYQFYWPKLQSCVQENDMKWDTL